MASYTVNLVEAARRHLGAAERLDDGPHRAEAGYLFGLAAECAVKEIARGLPTGRGQDVFRAHFPDLRHLLLDKLQGRQATPLANLLKDDFMAGWQVAMRYAPSAETLARPIDDWRRNARDALNLMSEVA